MKCTSDSEVKITFVGDVMIEHTRLNYYKGDAGYCFDPIFEKCAALFEKSDYVVANLETPIAGEEMQYSFRDYSFNTPSEILLAMSKAHISMVTTANNHCLDRGIEGLNTTIDNIENSSLDYVGTTRTGDSPKPLIKKISGISIGFLSYTYGTEACYNLNYLKKKDSYQVCLLQNQELSSRPLRFLVRSHSLFARILRKIVRVFMPSFFDRSPEEYEQNNKLQRIRLLDDISNLKKQNVDLIVMCLHSGGQFNESPTAFTMKEICFLRKHGVDVVVCNHEHLIQRFSLSDDVGVAFCLGNFTSDYGIARAPYDKRAECSIALHVYLNKNGSGVKKRYTFSVMHSICDDCGRIITVPLFDEYNRAVNLNDREKLMAINSECVARFVGLNGCCGVMPSEEYSFTDFTQI